MTQRPRAGLGLCLLVTFVAIIFIYAGLDPISQPTSMSGRFLVDIEPEILRQFLALCLFILLTALAGGVLAIAWNRIAPALFPGVGAMRIADGYVIAMLVMMF